MNEGDLPAEAFVTSPVPTVQFYIPATSSLQERRPRTLKHGDTFGVFDHYGDIAPGEASPEGLFHDDTRFLSSLQLLVNDRRPLLLSSTVQDNNALLIADLTNPDFFADGRLDLPRNTIHIVRARFIWEGCAHERLAVRNFADRTHRVRLAFAFQSDFADLFEVRGHRRPRRGKSTVELRGRRAIAFNYLGLDGLRRQTVLEFGPEPDQISSEAASYDLVLEPSQRISLFLSVKCNGKVDRQRRPEPFFVCLREARRTLRLSSSRATSVASSNAIFNEVMRRSVADLYMMLTDTEHGPYPYAGIPWFSTVFGRDGIITAMQMLWVDPAIARGVLQLLAAHQARHFDPDADAEPGKILHEMRRGEMARLKEIPFGLYYGSIDSTPLFLMLAGMYFERTGDLATIHKLWPSLEAALRWLDEHGDRDGDHFIEYQARTGRGLGNQGWKDSRKFGIPRRRPARRWTDRAVRGAGLRLRRPTRGRTARRGARFRRPGRRASTSRPMSYVSVSRPHSGAMISAPTLSPWTAPSNPAVYAPPTPGRCCCRASPLPTAPPASPTSWRTATSSRAGASAPWPPPRRATIPCPITTARSGRMITP